MDGDGFQAWLDRYVDAWRTYDPAAIADLFSVDATYRYHPDDAPLQGRSAIVADWLAAPDAPGSWRCEYRSFVVAGDRGVMHGSTEYLAADGTTIERRYRNVWLCVFDPDGRCTDFTEYYMSPRLATVEASIEAASAA